LIQFVIDLTATVGSCDHNWTRRSVPENNGCLEGDLRIASADTARPSAALRVLGWLARRFAGSRGEGWSFGGSLSMLPDRSLFPLFREGLDPVPRLREQPPVSRLPVPLGIRAWLVTG